MKYSKKVCAIFLIAMVICCWKFIDLDRSTVYGSSGGSMVEEPSFPEEPSTPGEDPGSGSGSQPSEPSTGTPPSGNTGGSSSGSASSGTGSAQGGTSSTSGGTTSSTDQTSADTRLSELQINCGQLVPEFSPDQYNYTVYVEYDGEPIDCGTSAVGIDPSVSIRAEGPTEITGEDAQKRVIAEAADGSYSEYVIDIHVVKDNELLIGNALYVISEPKDIDSLPGEFREDDAGFASEKIKVARSSDGRLSLICYVNADDPEDILWYMLDENSGTTYPAQIVELNGQQYIVISSGNEFVYGDNEGTAGYFLVDPQTGEIIFSLSEDGQAQSAGDSVNTIIIIAAIAAVILCIAFCIVVYRKYHINNAKISSAENKYFRPYLSPDEEYMAQNNEQKKAD